MHINAKPPMSNDPAAKWLEKQSKAALIDMLIDMLRADQESLDDPVTEESARKRLDRIVEERKRFRFMRWVDRQED